MDFDKVQSLYYKELVLNHLYNFEHFDLRCILSILRNGTIKYKNQYKRFDRYQLKEYVRDEVVDCDYKTILLIINFIKTIYPDIIVNE